MENKQEIKLERISDSKIYKVFTWFHGVELRLWQEETEGIFIDAKSLVQTQLQADQQVVDKLQAEITRLKAKKKEMIIKFEAWLNDIQKNSPEWQSFKAKYLSSQKE